MGAPLKIYSGNGVSFSFAGIDIADGKGVDAFCRIEKLDPKYTLRAGIDGQATRSESGNNIHRVTLIVQQTADVNDKLSAIHATDLAVQNGAGVGPLQVRDRNGRSRLNDAQAFIEKYPDQDFENEAKDLEWVFLCPDPDRVVGGNETAVGVSG